MEEGDEEAGEGLPRRSFSLKEADGIACRSWCEIHGRSCRVKRFRRISRWQVQLSPLGDVL